MAGAGYEVRDEPSVVGVKEIRRSALVACDVHEKNRRSAKMRLIGRGIRGNWEASARSALAVRGKPFLYKLYVSRDTSQQPALSAQADPALDFLRVFAPALQRSLFAAN